MYRNFRSGSVKHYGKKFCTLQTLSVKNKNKSFLGKSKSGSVKHNNKSSFSEYVIVVLLFHGLQNIINKSSLLTRYC